MKLYFVKQNAINIVRHNSKRHETQFSDKLNCLNYSEVILFTQ